MLPRKRCWPASRARRLQPPAHVSPPRPATCHVRPHFGPKEQAGLLWFSSRMVFQQLACVRFPLSDGFPSIILQNRRKSLALSPWLRAHAYGSDCLKFTGASSPPAQSLPQSKHRGTDTTACGAPILSLRDALRWCSRPRSALLFRHLLGEFLFLKK